MPDDKPTYLGPPIEIVRQISDLQAAEDKRTGAAGRDPKTDADPKNLSHQNAGFPVDPPAVPRAPYGSKLRVKHPKVLLTCTRCGNLKPAGHFYLVKTLDLESRGGYSEWCKRCFKKYADQDEDDRCKTPQYGECTHLEYCEKSTAERKNILAKAWRARRTAETHQYGAPLREYEREPARTIQKHLQAKLEQRIARRLARQTKIYGHLLSDEEKHLLSAWATRYRSTHGHNPTTAQRVKFFKTLPQKKSTKTP